MATEIIEVEVPPEGSWSDFNTLVFHNQHTPKIYFFVAMDCDHNTHMTYRMMPKIEIDFNIVT